MYKAITHEIEPKLVRCRRKYSLRLVIYTPLAHAPCQFPIVHTAYDRNRSAVA